MSRQRSRTSGSKDASRPKSGQHPRKLEDRIAILHRREAEDASAFIEAMGIMTEVRF